MRLVTNNRVRKKENLSARAKQQQGINGRNIATLFMYEKVLLSVMKTKCKQEMQRKGSERGGKVELLLEIVF